jgi:hypothetical protein
MSPVGRGGERLACSRPGCFGPRAPLSPTTPAVFAVKRCEHNVADMAYPVISYTPAVFAAKRCERALAATAYPVIGYQQKSRGGRILYTL